MTDTGIVAAGGGRFRSMAARVSELRGWRQLTAAAGAGAMAALALPPFHALPLLFVAFSALVWLLQGTPGAGRAFVVGWAFGLGFFVVGLYWTGLSMLVDASRFAIFIPFAVLGLPAALAVYCGAVALIWRRLVVSLRLADGVGAVLLLAILWTLGEFLRGRLFTGFPWNLLGYVWTASDVLMQPAAWVGVHGLTLLTVMTAAMPAALATRDLRRLRGWAPLLFVVAVCLAAVAAAAGRLAEARPGFVDGVFLRVVQGNVPQEEKWRPDTRDAHLQRQIDLSRRPGFDRLTHVIWSETAAPFFVESDPVRLRRTLQAVPPGGYLLAGAPRRELGPGDSVRLWNSLYALDGDGRVLDIYDKAHLVPFGEYLPVRPLLSRLGFAKLTDGTIDFLPGHDRSPRSPAGLPPYRALICYEAIFPGEMAAPVRPQWLLNITNDGWFGRSSGPYQHFAMARMRAVEQGVPLVRAANTGISAIVDPWGRVLSRIGLGVEGVIDGGLPAALSPTLYARWGEFPTSIAMIVLAAVALRRRR